MAVPPMKVLIADDSALVRRLLVQMVSAWGYEADACADGVEAWDRLQEKDAPVLAIVDWVMPRLSGVDLCRRIRQQRREPYIYIIVLTANDRKEGVIEAFSAGADDYLQKPPDEKELEARLRAGRRIIELNAELVEAREALRAQATHDALTGLWNRGAIFDFLRHEFDRAWREKGSLAVLLADIDHFKGVNDTLGHAAGDAALCEVARRLSSVTRPYDAVGRYGGEEFLVVLPGCGRRAALKRADQLRLAIGSTPMEFCGHTTTLTASVGAAVNDPGDALDVEELVRAADEALYRAKNAGRNRVEIA